jgi:hypothetical protein
LGRRIFTLLSQHISLQDAVIGMGRNSLTYRQRLEKEVNRWSPFRKALLADEREVFDRLLDQAFRYVHAGTMYPLRDAFDVFLMSSLMSHEERLGVLEKVLKASMKVDGRIDDFV